MYQQLCNEYIALLQSLSDGQINISPSSGGWSVGQVISHITKANQSSFLGAKGEVCSRDIGEKLAELELTFLDFDVKMKSPDFILPDLKTFSKVESIQKISKCFEALIDALDDSKMDEILNSPLGVLTKWEIANFMIFHSKRHLYQLKYKKIRGFNHGIPAYCRPLLLYKNASTNSAAKAKLSFPLVSEVSYSSVSKY